MEFSHQMFADLGLPEEFESPVRLHTDCGGLCECDDASAAPNDADAESSPESGP
jgi:hypothetical protein